MRVHCRIGATDQVCIADIQCVIALATSSPDASSVGQPTFAHHTHLMRVCRHVTGRPVLFNIHYARVVVLHTAAPMATLGLLMAQHAGVSWHGGRPLTCRQLCPH